MEKEQLMQFQLIEQEVNQLNQQASLIEQNISELNELKKSLDEIENTKNKDILVNIGKKIYLPVEIKEEKLIVEVGNKNLIKKSFKETKEVIGNQLEKLFQIKENLTERLRQLDLRMSELIEQVNSGNSDGHECDENCDHDH